MNRAQRRVAWHPGFYVPRYEPEVVEAGARGSGYDRLDKVSTTSVDTLVVHGVELSSRYGKAEELEKMAAIVLTGLSLLQCKLVKSVWYNSKYSDSYTITLRSDDAKLARQIGLAFQAGALWLKGGHNGITVEGPDGKTLADIDCTWDEERVR
jgi:hypothetical protein